MSIRTFLYRRTLAPIVHRLFYRELVRRTDNFGTVTWLGQPIWQPIGDAWLIQEAIAELKPALLIETGTNRGGSALYYAHLFDALGKGEVITVDVETMHDLSHPRIAFLIGSSTDPEIVRQIRERATQADGDSLSLAWTRQLGGFLVGGDFGQRVDRRAGGRSLVGDGVHSAGI